MSAFRAKPPKGALLSPGDPLSKGIIAAYLFNEGFGTKVADSSLPGRTTQSLTAFNGMGWAKTPYGPGVDGGAGGYWQGSLAPAFPGSGKAFTVSMRCMLRSITSSVNSAVVELSGAAQSFTCQMALVGGIYYAATDAVTWNLTLPGAPPPLNVWQELTWTSDGINTVRFLVDGVQSASATVTLTNAALTTITVGRRISQSGEADAIHSRLLIWNRVIPDKQIARLAPDPFRMFRRRTSVFKAGAVTTTGTASITEAADTLAGTGTVAVAGTASMTEGADTLVGAATVAVAGTAAVNEAADTLSAAAVVAITGGAALTEASDTLTCTAVVGVAGTSTIIEAPDTITAVGTVAVVGTGSLTEAPDTLAASGSGGATPGAIGSATLTESPDTLAGAASVAVVGSASVTEAPDILSGFGSLIAWATATLTERPDTLAASANNGVANVSKPVAGRLGIAPRVTGTLSIISRVTGRLTITPA
jgi:hypothetical protein